MKMQRFFTEQKQLEKTKSLIFLEEREHELARPSPGLAGRTSE